MPVTHRAKTIGVLGGMGPEATVDFMTKVIAATPARADQDHLHMLVDHNPGVPDRQKAILDGAEDPAPALARMAARLEAAGAEFLVIPCNTAYVFKDAVAAATSIPLLSIVEVTVDEAKRRVPGIKAVGVLATAGCLAGGVYQRALAAAGIDALTPAEEELAELMELVYAIKAAKHDEAIGQAMARLAGALQDRGAESVIAGCTEIPLVLGQRMLSIPLISSTDVLARATVAHATGNEQLLDKVP
jgi:aspartate racemase